MPRKIPNTIEISAYLHCRLCLEELTSAQAAGTMTEVSPAQYQRLSVGWTPLGLQVVCDRHQVNVIHIDFEGVRHRANTTIPV